MTEKLFENIQTHLSMLDLAVHSSEKIKAFAQIENLDGVASETENRERIVNIITQTQFKIEEYINQIDASKVLSSDMQILKSWFSDLTLFSEKMIALDQETIELLGQQREDTTKEIALIFKNKQIFKSYNHADKK